MIFNTFTLPEVIKVAPLQHLRGLDTKGVRVSRDYKEYTFRDLFTNADLMMRYAIIILGGTQTTGYGKFVMAKALACHIVEGLTSAKKLP